jgi:hypothetical protein
MGNVQRHQRVATPHRPLAKTDAAIRRIDGLQHVLYLLL